MEPSDGGFDLAWPSGPGTYGVFANRVAKQIGRQGYCVVQMFQSDDARANATDAAGDIEDFGLPAKENEQAFLGEEANSEISWVRSTGAEPMTDEKRLEDPLSHYSHSLRNSLHVLAPAFEYRLGVRCWPEISATLLRRPRHEDDDRQLVSLEEDAEAENSSEKLGQLINFQRDKRFCAMYIIDTGGGTLELQPTWETGLEAINLRTTRDKLVIFHHEMMSYRYKPSGSEDLVVQCWFMEEPAQVHLTNFDNTQQEVQRVFGGPKTNPSMQVHVIAANSRFPGNGNYFKGATSFFQTQVDGFVKVPFVRWDMDAYYDAERKDGAQPGKSASQHSGFIRDSEWELFDNLFFGVSDRVSQHMAPCERALIQNSFELLYLAGFPSLKDLQGRKMLTVAASCGSDVTYFDNFQGADDESKQAWLHSTVGGFHVGHATRVAHIFGLTGTTSTIDTACSSSLVSTNTAYAALRQAPTTKIVEGQSITSQNLLTPWGYIGMSMAGMVGPSGRCLTFDVGASGFSRGEGFGGVFMRVSDDPQCSIDRLGAMCAGFINQDGRSASLTAPNGPSQQLCMKSGIRQADLIPEDITYVETHGTGTALGDPIETGSCRSIFWRREVPLPVTTGKSHTGHLEGAAGMVNIIKVLVALNHSTTAPNVHLKTLNPHIENVGFPGCWPTEIFDNDGPWHCVATNAFGFGGTNSHADFFGRCRYGPHKEHSRSVTIEQLDWATVDCVQCQRPMCWRCGILMTKAAGGQKHYCTAVREEHASYEYCSGCYTGGYVCGADSIPERGINIDVLEDTSSYGPQALNSN